METSYDESSDLYVYDTNFIMQCPMCRTFDYKTAYQRVLNELLDSDYVRQYLSNEHNSLLYDIVHSSIANDIRVRVQIEMFKQEQRANAAQRKENANAENTVVFNLATRPGRIDAVVVFEYTGPAEDAKPEEEDNEPEEDDVTYTTMEGEFYRMLCSLFNI